MNLRLSISAFIACLALSGCGVIGGSEAKYDAVELIGDLLRSAKSNKPYVVYPNSGRVWDAKNKVWTGSGAVGFSNELVSEWVEAGAEIVGGCCGIGAAEIEQLSLSK